MVRKCPACERDFTVSKKNPNTRFCSRSCVIDARRIPTVLRFWNKLVTHVPGQCWPWIGYRNESGYGVLAVNGGLMLAHRYAWTLENGPIPDGAEICHRCDNPACCNPEHLFSGTHQDNMDDMVAKARYARLSGSLNGKAKLTEDEVLSVRRSTMKQKDTADLFGITQGAVSKIQLLKTWSHLPSDTTRG